MFGTAVQFCRVNLACFHVCKQLLLILVIVGHFQCQSRIDARCGILDGVPVGHNYSVKTELVTQHIVQFGIFRHALPVEQVVTAHHSPGLCLASDAECFEINLTQSTFVHVHACPHAAEFAAVAAKVFKRCSDVLFLHRIDVLTRHYACQIRIFGKILEVATACRQTFDVDRRPEYNVHAIFDTVVGDGIAHLMRQVGIPGVGKHLRARVRHGRCVAFTPACRVQRHTHADGTVRHTYLGNFTVKVVSIPAVNAHYKLDFLFCCKFCYVFFHFNSVVTCF